MGFIHSLVFSP